MTRIAPLADVTARLSAYIEEPQKEGPDVPTSSPSEEWYSTRHECDRWILERIRRAPVRRRTLKALIHFLWRPMLSDPGDEFVLELAVAAGCRFIVTHNIKDFSGADRFGVSIVTPGEFLRLLEREQ